MTSNGKALTKQTEEAKAMRDIMWKEMDMVVKEVGGNYIKQRDAYSKILRRYFKPEEGK